MPGADAHGAGRRMQLCAAKRRPDPARAYVRERVLLAVAVEIDGNFQVHPHALTQCAGDLVGLGKGGAAERHDRNDVSRSNARVDPAVFAKVDVPQCHLDRSHQRIYQLGLLTDKRNDDAIVVGVCVDVEKVGAGSGSGELGDDIYSSSF